MSDSYWGGVWRQFRRHRVGVAALWVVALFALVGIYAPLFASSRPLFVIYDGQIYFPLFRYLFYSGFYTKRIDLFFNVLMVTLPLWVLSLVWLRGRWRAAAWLALACLQVGLFGYFIWRGVRDPAADLTLLQERHEMLVGEKHSLADDPLLAPFPHRPSWAADLRFTNEYGRLNQILRYQQWRGQNERFVDQYQALYAEQAKRRWAVGRALSQQHLDKMTSVPTLWQEWQRHREEELARQEEIARSNELAYLEAKEQWSILQESYAADPPAAQATLASARALIDRYEVALSKVNYLRDQQQWLEEESGKIRFQVPALLRPFHWQEDAGGEQSLNQYVHWYDLTRINRKDLVASLLFGIRVSLVVGAAAVFISLLIGIPLGAVAGYYGGRTDLALSRGVEVWESMPVFFMLLMIVAILQTKSVFVVVAVLGVFGWTGFCRYLRGEVLKQRNLAYVEACRSMGYSDWRILFSHILPNAIPPLLTLLPFSVMAAITSEAGLSFLGLGEEGSCSWGVLMDEGRSVFPAESYLLWPPAIMLTLLLVAIALVGDALRDALDPKMR
jgi:peptide/nickel transport system permease protein